MNDYKKRKAKSIGCPACSSTHLHFVHTASAFLPWWWHVECQNCHYCGKTKLFLRRADKAGCAVYRKTACVTAREMGEDNDE